MSDYLWDKDGEPDPELERLEQLLGAFEYEGLPPPWPAPRRRARGIWISAGVLAASALIALLAILFKPWRPDGTRHDARVIAPARAAWAATVTGGAATVDGHPFAGDALPAGAWLETGSARARLLVADLGTVELGPGTRARIVETGPALHELELARGTLSASVTAPPRRFVVETARAVVSDLGCAFSITVDEAGRGALVVTEGQVAASDRAGREVVVPAGAECALTEHGPGAPYFSDASPGLRAALARYSGDASAWPAVPAAAGPQDRRTLRLLLSTAASSERGLLLERLGELDAADAPAPKLKHSTKKNPKTPAGAPARKSEAALKGEAAHKGEPARKIDSAHKSEPASQKIDSAHKTEPARKAEPGRKTGPGVNMKHDALQDLERSAE